MNFNKDYINHLHLVIVITFVISILIISSTTELSFAKLDDKNKDDEDNKDYKKDVSVSPIDKNNKETLNGDLKEINIQNDMLNGRYPDQFFVCGYPQQVITDYNYFEKINCN